MGHSAEGDGSEKARMKEGWQQRANCRKGHHVPLVASVMASAAACTRSEILECMRWDKKKACLGVLSFVEGVLYLNCVYTCRQGWPVLPSNLICSRPLPLHALLPTMC